MDDDKRKRIIDILEVLLKVDDVETIHCTIESLIDDLKDDMPMKENND